MPGWVDYALARQATIRAWRAGLVSREDVCDAHPDLLRAANFCGEDAGRCPVCSADDLKIVSYAFSDELGRENGRTWDRSAAAELDALSEARLYTVEVCVDCHWNHLVTQQIRGGSQTQTASARQV